jgi:hypothetical protein
VWGRAPTGARSARCSNEPPGRIPRAEPPIIYPRPPHLPNAPGSIPSRRRCCSYRRAPRCCPSCRPQSLLGAVPGLLPFVGSVFGFCWSVVLLFLSLIIIPITCCPPTFLWLSPSPSHWLCPTRPGTRLVSCPPFRPPYPVVGRGGSERRTGKKSPHALGGWGTANVLKCLGLARENWNLNRNLNWNPNWNSPIPHRIRLRIPY